MSRFIIALDFDDPSVEQDPEWSLRYAFEHSPLFTNAKVLGVALATEPSLLLGVYSDWCRKRTELSAQEESGAYPAPGKWHDSDDDGVALAGQFADWLGELMGVPE